MRLGTHGDGQRKAGRLQEVDAETLHTVAAYYWARSLAQGEAVLSAANRASDYSLTWLPCRRTHSPVGHVDDSLLPRRTPAALLSRPISPTSPRRDSRRVQMLAEAPESSSEQADSAGTIGLCLARRDRGGPVPGRHRRISGGRLMAEAGSGSPDGCGTEARPCESARGHGTASRTHSAGFAEESGREAASSDSTSHARAELGSGVKLQVASLPVRLERGSSHHRTRVSV